VTAGEHVVPGISLAQSKYLSSCQFFVYTVGKKKAVQCVQK